MGFCCIFGLWSKSLVFLPPPNAVVKIRIDKSNRGWPRLEPLPYFAWREIEGSIESDNDSLPMTHFRWIISDEPSFLDMTISNYLHIFILLFRSAHAQSTSANPPGQCAGYINRYTHEDQCVYSFTVPKQHQNDCKGKGYPDFPVNLET